MLEIIKFCTLWILPPAVVVFLLLCLTVLAYRKKYAGRSFLAISLLVLWFFSLRIGANLLCWPLERMYPYPDRDGQELASCNLIVLTGAGAEPGVPDFSGTGAPGPVMGKTMLTGFRLQRATGLPLLVTGGAVFKGDASEADIAVRIFKDMGIPEDSLIIENEARNTAQNASYTRELLEKRGWNKAALVVAALHAPRAAQLFRREGVDVLVFPSHYRRPGSWEPSLWRDITPTASNLEDSVAALHEYIALLAMRIGLY